LIVSIKDSAQENMLRKSLESLMNTRGGVANARALASTGSRRSVLLASVRDIAYLGVEDEEMNLLETYIEEIHSEHERKTDFGYVVDVDITENCYGGITRKKKTFLKDEWADIKKKGFYWS
jgi:hypothetical protein